jgi:hypothetical protein
MNKIVLWELAEHGGPLLLGNYRARGLGDLTVPGIGVDSSTLDYSLLGIAATLLVTAFVLQRKASPPKRKRRKKSSGPALSTVIPVLLLGIGGAYLLGQATSGQVAA